jgi:hypothetical protein
MAATAASEGAGFQDSPTTLHARATMPVERPAGRPAHTRRPRLPSATLQLSRTLSRELTQRFQRPGSSRRRPAASAAIGNPPLRRKLAHTVPRGLRKPDRLRGTRAAGADRSGPVRTRSAAAPVAALRVPPLPEPSMSVSAARAEAVPRTSEAMRAAVPAATVRTPGPAPAAPAVASATAGRTSAPAATLASSAIAPTPGVQRAGAGLPAASPRPPSTHAASPVRNHLETTGVVVVAASRRPARGAPGRERTSRVVRLGRFRSVLPAVFALLAALAAFALAYRWLL